MRSSISSVAERRDPTADNAIGGAGRAEGGSYDGDCGRSAPRSRAKPPPAGAEPAKASGPDVIPAPPAAARPLSVSRPGASLRLPMAARRPVQVALAPARRLRWATIAGRRGGPHVAESAESASVTASQPPGRWPQAARSSTTTPSRRVLASSRRSQACAGPGAPAAGVPRRRGAPAGRRSPAGRRHRSRSSARGRAAPARRRLRRAARPGACRSRPRAGRGPPPNPCRAARDSRSASPRRRAVREPGRLDPAGASRSRRSVLRALAPQRRWL